MFMFRTLDGTLCELLNNETLAESDSVLSLCPTPSDEHIVESIDTVK